MKGFLVPVFELIAMLSIYSMLSGEVQNLIFIALGALVLIGVVFLLDRISDSGGSERASLICERSGARQTDGPRTKGFRNQKRRTGEISRT